MSFSFLIDTGASIYLIDEETFNKFKTNPALMSVPTKIFVYGANPSIVIIGLFRAEIESKLGITIADIYVASGTSSSLLNYQTALDLDLVSLRVNTVQPRTSVRQTNIDEPAELHPALFKGIGKLKDIEVKLHIDKNVRPVTQPYRRVPFHLQKLVDSEIDADVE